MFAEFHGLSENPFTIMPSPRLAWLGSCMRKVRAELCNSVLEGRGLLLLSGVPGVGKSLALTLLTSDLKQSDAPYSIHVLNCGLQASAAELLRRVADELAGDDGNPATDRLTVLVIDEAQHLGAAELSELLQEPASRAGRLRFILAGTPELVLTVNEVLADHPETVAAHWSLEPLPPDEISSYIAGRLEAGGGREPEIFTADAIESLARHSGGVPRRLNVLCSRSLFLAWREGRQSVDASIVEAALPDFYLEPPSNAARLSPSARMPTSPQRPLIQATVLPEAKDDVAELESDAIEAAAEPTTLDDVQSEAMVFPTARAPQPGSIARETKPPETAAVRPGAEKVETCEYVSDIAVAATSLSRETAQRQPKARAVARPHRPAIVPIGAQIGLRPALYAFVTVLAAIVFLLVAINWRARDEQLAAHAIAPITPSAILPADPPIIAPTRQPTAPSTTPVAAEAVPVEEAPASAMLPTSDHIPHNHGQMASMAEPVDPLRADADVPPLADEEPQSAVQGPPASETISSAELAKLLARADQQIDALALTTPAGDNAFETLQLVLTAIPAQPDALQGVHDIASKYAMLAAQAKQRGELSLARRYLRKGLDIVPDHPDLLALEQKLPAPPASQTGTIQSAGSREADRPATSGFASRMPGTTK